MTLREFVREYREAHDLSQRQFAERCSLSNGYISMLERNRNPKTGLPLTPSIPALKKIASGMGMSMNDLFLAVDDMPGDLSALGDIQERKCSNAEYESEYAAEAMRLLMSLSEAKREEAMNYLRYLSEQTK